MFYYAYKSVKNNYIIANIILLTSKSHSQVGNSTIDLLSIRRCTYPSCTVLYSSPDTMSEVLPEDFNESAGAAAIHTQEASVGAPSTDGEKEDPSNVSKRHSKRLRQEPAPEILIQDKRLEITLGSAREELIVMSLRKLVTEL